MDGLKEDRAIHIYTIQWRIKKLYWSVFGKNWGETLNLKNLFEVLIQSAESNKNEG